MGEGVGFSIQQQSIGSQKPTMPIQKISQSQMEERRKKGLCYNCDYKWQYGHKCQTPKLFSIDFVELGEGSTELEEKGDDVMEFTYYEVLPEISLHAIIGSLNPKTMQVIGWIGGQEFVILIDSGSTHNFVDTLICKKAHLLVRKIKGLE